MVAITSVKILKYPFTLTLLYHNAYETQPYSVFTTSINICQNLATKVIKMHKK